MPESRRLPQLDALRGIAALVVVLCHWTGTFTTFENPHGLAFILSRTPARLLIDGNSAVVLFLVLSGFVLALPIIDQRQPAIGAYLIRRACRLYPMAWAAGLAALALVALTGTTPMTQTAWTVQQWTHEPTSGAVLAHLLLISPSHAIMNFDPPLWTLVHELRVSLIFPLLAAVVLARRPGYAAMTFVAVTVVFSTGNPDGQSLGKTLVLLLPFVVGIELARSQHAIVAALTRHRGRTVALLLLALVVTPAVSAVPPALAVAMQSIGVAIVLPTACAAVIVSVALTPTGARRLDTRPTRFLGDVSYSLYLVHVPILLVLLRVTGGASVPLAAVGIGASLLVAYACHRLIERPGIALGKRLAQRIGQPRSIPAPEAA